jgi:hypothetical protein
MATHAGKAEQAGDKVKQAGNSNSLELAFAGLVAYNVAHLLVGWLALQTAWGRGHRERRQLRRAEPLAVADQPFGKMLLWLAAVGPVALALGQTSEAIWGLSQPRQSQTAPASRSPARPRP